MTLTSNTKLYPPVNRSDVRVTVAKALSGSSIHSILGEISYCDRISQIYTKNNSEYVLELSAKGVHLDKAVTDIRAAFNSANLKNIMVIVGKDEKNSSVCTRFIDIEKDPPTPEVLMDSSNRNRPMQIRDAIPQVLQLHWYGSYLPTENFTHIFNFLEINTRFKIKIYTDDLKHIINSAKKYFSSTNHLIDTDMLTILKRKKIELLLIQNIGTNSKDRIKNSLLKNCHALLQSEGNGIFANQAAKTDLAKILTLAEDGGGWTIHWRFLPWLQKKPLPIIPYEGFFPASCPNNVGKLLLTSVFACSKANAKAALAWQSMLEVNLDYISKQQPNIGKPLKAQFISDQEKRPFSFATLSEYNAHYAKTGKKGIRVDRTMRNTFVMFNNKLYDEAIPSFLLFRKEHNNYRSLTNSYLKWGLGNTQDMKPIYFDE